MGVESEAPNVIDGMEDGADFLAIIDSDDDD